LLPSVFIIGPPRTGTSWLHEILRRHIVLPQHTKDTRFFDVHFYRGLEWYRGHFPKSDGTREAAEVAPTYFASPPACDRIKQSIPTARIICIFRHPVERIVSLYRLRRAFGMIPWDFEEALIRDAELIESSRYATHLRRWQQAFGPERVLPTFYDDLRDDPQAYVDLLADFVGMPRFTLAPWELHAMHASESMTHPRSYSWTHRGTLVADWLKARRFGSLIAMINGSPVRKLFLGGGKRFSPPSPTIAATICELLRDEISDLEHMVNRDLSAWKPRSVSIPREIHCKRATAVGVE
jgi:hypothetical protein